MVVLVRRRCWLVEVSIGNRNVSGAVWLAGGNVRRWECDQITHQPKRLPAA